jgi:hypothetical protein
MAAVHTGRRRREASPAARSRSDRAATKRNGERVGSVGYGRDSVPVVQRRVAAHLRDGRRSRNTGAAYLRSLEIEHAIDRSAASGSWPGAATEAPGAEGP